jgi:hypothetical protein
LTIAAVIVAIVEPFACQDARNPAGAGQSDDATGANFERLSDTESAAGMSAAQAFVE